MFRVVKVKEFPRRCAVCIFIRAISYARACPLPDCFRDDRHITLELYGVKYPCLIR
jgi:hypothetical protein